MIICLMQLKHFTLHYINICYLCRSRSSLLPYDMIASWASLCLSVSLDLLPILSIMSPCCSPHLAARLPAFTCKQLPVLFNWTSQWMEWQIKLIIDDKTIIIHISVNYFTYYKNKIDNWGQKNHHQCFTRNHLSLLYYNTIFTISPIL